MDLSQSQWDTALHAAHGELASLAVALGVNYNSLRREVGARKRDPDVASQRAMPQPIDLIPTPPLTVPGLTTFIYATDFHAPLHDIRICERIATVARDRAIATLVIGGDLFDFDSVSSHGRSEVQAGLQRTIESGGALLDWFAQYFDRIYLLPGNHDRRVAKKIDEPLSFELLVRAGLRHAKVSTAVDDDAQIVVTDNDYLYIGDVETGWVAGHPDRYSRTPVKRSVAAMRERRNVLLAHTHLQSLLWSDDGRYMLIEPGHATSAAATPYVMRSAGLSTFAAWRSGFVVVADNRPTLYGDGLA